jgi:NHL repeat
MGTKRREPGKMLHVTNKAVWTGKSLFLLLAMAAVLLSLLAGSAQAKLSFQYSIGSPGAGAGQFEEPAGIAVNHSTGDLYVADRQNHRIQQLTEDGDFIRAWGFDVVDSGADDKAPVNEVQYLRIRGTSGLFRLEVMGSMTGGNATGDIAAGSNVITNLTTASTKASYGSGGKQVFLIPGDDWSVGMPVEGPSIPAGTTITKVVRPPTRQQTAGEWRPTTIELSQLPTGFVSEGILTSHGPAPFAVGQTVVGPGIPAGTTIIAASSGTLTLSNNATASQSNAGISAGLPYNASAAEVEAIINELPGVAAGGGAVTVTGGPGDAGGANPYLIEASTGPIAAKDIPASSLDDSDMGRPIGTELNCYGFSEDIEDTTPGGAGAISYQWLSNGQPIPGATARTYTLSPGDSGKVVQCRVAGLYKGSVPNDTNYQTNYIHAIAGTASSTLPPVGPEILAEPSTNEALTVGSPGGQSVTCNAGRWSGNPTSYTYQWWATGGPMRPPVTSSSPSEEITLTEGEVSETASIQCSVTATNAGGSSIVYSQMLNTSPPPSGASGIFQIRLPVMGVQDAGVVHPVITKVNGGPVFEVCQASPPSNDVCKAGVAGPSLGQLSSPRGVAVDNSSGGNGDVYVVDDGNVRVQKFTASGTPLLTVGKEVNEFNAGNICTVSDFCGTGVPIPNDEPGVFGGWQDQGFSFAELGNPISVDPNGDVYVADPHDQFANLGGLGHLDIGAFGWRARVQKFDSSLTFVGQVFPSGKLEPWLQPLAIATDSEGEVIGSTEGGLFGGEEGVDLWEPEEFTPEGTQQNWADHRAIHHEGQHPKQVAVDPVDNKIWLTDTNVAGNEGAHQCGEEGLTRIAILAYDKENHQLDCEEPSGLGILPRVSGLAVGVNGLLYASVQTQGRIKVFKIPQEAAPQIRNQRVDRISTEGAEVHAEVNPNFDVTTYHFEYGTAPCSSNPCTSLPAKNVSGLKFFSVKASVPNLSPGTRYYYRLVAENSIDTTAGPDQTFRTFPFIDLENDVCDNGLARKQTRTAGTFDCRAYELASADFTGGYDVVSDLAPGQTPYEGYPEADGKVLYSVRDGGIPGTGNPTNRGPDPYVAVRGDDGVWTTRYVGIPADDGHSTDPFSSTLADADSGLNSFVFAGPEICSPCFADGSTGVPLRLPDGQLVQGMAGSMQPPQPETSGTVLDYLSDDSSHFVFGSSSQFEPEGNSNGDATIYDRDLTAGVTQVVSTDENGDTLQGDGIGELDISADGERIVVGKKAVADDSTGNSHWQLYMHVGQGDESVDLTPGTTSGVLYGGMTADGSRVFYATEDQILPADTDNSADVYEAHVDDGGGLDLRLISVTAGGPSNTDACSPSGEPDTWNAVSGDGHCNALVISGGGGVASGDGTFYFISPEQLDGSSGTADEPNIYVVRPDGSPHFVATLDSASAHPPKPPPDHPLETSGFLEGLPTMESLATDQSNGDMYIIARGLGWLVEIDNTGQLKNLMFGHSFGPEGRSQVAVDNASTGVLENAVYVKKSANTVVTYAQTGAELGTLTGFTEVCGLTVDPSTGTVYVADAGGEATSEPPTIWSFEPSSPTEPISNADYTVTSLTTETEDIRSCQLAADGAGHVYAANRDDSGNPLVVFQTSEFSASGSLREGTQIKVSGSIPPTNAMAVDPATKEVYVDTGNKIVLLDENLKVLNTFGQGILAGSRGVTINEATKHVFATNGANIVEFGINQVSYSPIDHPAVIHAVKDNEVRYWSDFQTSPDRYALFSTKVPQIEGYDSNGKNMVYRYDAVNQELACPSCLGTEGAPKTDAALPSRGLGVTDDGRVFFNSADQLVMRDTNGVLDAYEWREPDPNDETKPNVALISTGFSAFPSSLLTVTRDGRDALFFTRETLVKRDVNGQAMKIYDARAGGGVFVIPNSPPCAASDECHGPGSETAPPPPIGTFRGTGGNNQESSGNHRRKKCKKGFVKKHGKCIKKKRNKKQRKRHAGRGQGGGK